MSHTVDRTAFARYVQQVLTRLNDLAFLETHPLALLLSEQSDARAGETIRRLLADSIERLRPSDTASRDSPGWRTYRQMQLRHLEDASLREVTRELLISKRQAERDHSMAVKAITAMLWARYCKLTRGEPAPVAPVEAQSVVAEIEPTAEGDTIHSELAKLGSSLPKGPTDLPEVLQDVLATVRLLAESRHAAFTTSPNTDLPAVAVNRVVLRQILLNLMSYVLDVGVGSAISLSLVEGSGNLALEIAVAPQNDLVGKSRPSMEAETALGVARKLSEMQGASLRMEGEYRAFLSLPTATLSTVLVVDDNPDLVRLFRRYLRGQPYRFIQATSGDSALDLARQRQPALITLDVLMPGEDGWEILRRLKAEPATERIPVVVCSVLPERSIALSLGVVDFLSKPVTEQLLTTVLQRWLPTG